MLVQKNATLRSIKVHKNASDDTCPIDKTSFVNTPIKFDVMALHALFDLDNTDKEGNANWIAFLIEVYSYLKVRFKPNKQREQA